MSDDLWAHFNSLSKETQKGVLEDWVARMRLGYMRGEGLVSHASYLQLIADENSCTIQDVLDLNGYPT